MDGVAEEVAPLDAASGLRLQSKENEFSVKSASGPPVGSHEMIIPTEPDYCHTSPHHVLGDILEGKILSRSLSSLDPLGHPCASPRSMDDVTGIVEELTVRNYDNLNLAVVGTSSNGDRHGRTNQWQHLYETSGGSASGSSHRNFDNHAGSSIWEDMACTTFPEHLSHKSQRVDQADVSQQYSGPENKGIQGANALALNGGIRTKMLSRSGFSEYFIKNTLKGKGVICRGPPVDNYQLEQKIQNNLNIPTGPKVASNPPVNSVVKNIFPLTHEAAGSGIACPNHDGVNLREWLNNGHREINKSERLSIFKQIVQLVDYSHSQATALHELRPSCFKILPSNQVKYVGSSEVREFPGSIKEKKISNFTSWIAVKRASEPAQLNSRSLSAKKQRFTEDMNYRPWSQFPSKTDIKVQTPSFSENNVSDPRHPHYDYCELSPGADIGAWRSDSHHLATPTEQQLAIVSEPLEEKWYMSPEELNEGVTRVSSNIYSLGVFLFELLGNFTSERARSSALMDLRHRILPPNFLSENPKEAGFCLWLLHPDPASRPSSRNILESEVLSELKDGGKDVNLEELTSSIEQEDTESELLLHFLATMKEHKQKDTSKLVESIRRLESDIEEIGRRYCMGKPSEHSKDFTISDVIPLLPPISNAKESRWMGKINLLETAYFSMRSRIQLHEMDGSRRVDNDLLRSRDNWSSAQNDELQSPSDQLGDFFEGLCKYARYSKFEVRGVLRNGEFNNSANVICSLSFDRDEDYFATAGVSKKIKIFEFNSLLNQSVDIHYPAIEMSNKSKLSSVCWNNYIRNYLASTDYDGTVKLWDASTGQCFSEYNEHEKRAWSVHFSPVHPTKLASGSDDFSVKLWSINERNCLRTIRNIANVCCVQFSPHSSHLLAFGSADYRTYCYDLRNVRTPWCILAGHEKAVSYVKFLDSGTIITASTDNSLKLWDLQKTSPSGLSANACSLTLTGHTNEKNFVGLSVADGYITCGSETNEVYSYYRSLPMPITSHKFGSIDPISGKEIDDDNGQFVSSVCWRGKSDMLVAANSSGCIKVLQMV